MCIRDSINAEYGEGLKEDGTSHSGVRMPQAGPLWSRRLCGGSGLACTVAGVIAIVAAIVSTAVSPRPPESSKPDADIVRQRLSCIPHISHRQKRYQMINDPHNLLRLANASSGGLERCAADDSLTLTHASALRTIAMHLPGVELLACRVKGEQRLMQKLDSWRQPDQIADYLAARFVVGSDSALTSLLAELARRFDVIMYEDFLKHESKFRTGYRAVHVQVVGRHLSAAALGSKGPCPYPWPNQSRETFELPLGQLSAEVQVLPAPIAAVQNAYRGVYEEWRRKKTSTAKILTGSEADQGGSVERMRHAYLQAFLEWSSQ
eukprot:TRINITY_DN16162_c0_g1_i1.p1 TRINITY_DN16162_c0_g1~~TRINITY_DN16162_c0_g1_i1.p1  ORF type:complete len:321 (+),score=57.12 TRINITY_DN16162_c0_g1_i1:150-1112(+)